MKLADLNLLNEMPAYSSAKLAPQPQQLTHFYSDATLERDFTLVNEFSDDVAVYIRNDKVLAVIGQRMARPPKNDTMGLKCYVTLEFKELQHLNNKRLDLQLKGALQVDMVESHQVMKDRGFASLLYTSLVRAGYTIISDNKQYFHGKALWDSLIREQGVHYQVNLIKDGQWVLDDNNQLLVFNGHNIPPDQVWGPDGKNNTPHYTMLLVLRPK